MPTTLPIAPLITPVSGALGAEVRGVDLSQKLDAATVKRIHKAL
ncbi:MAG: hypothetical protein O2912_02725 [Proteobacteria bacterium]|nr:hypothetical protein [Pseudomonadota bacterium]